MELLYYLSFFVLYTSTLHPINPAFCTTTTGVEFHLVFWFDYYLTQR
jgi:hypothetical protein